MPQMLQNPNYVSITQKASLLMNCFKKQLLEKKKSPESVLKIRCFKPLGQENRFQNHFLIILYSRYICKTIFHPIQGITLFQPNVSKKEWRESQFLEIPTSITQM